MAGGGTKGETETEEEAKARLYGMVTNEVSFVDRAANKRVFLVLKRATDMATKITKAPGDAPANAPGAQAGTPPPGDAPADTGATGAAALTMQPQVKDQILAALTGFAEKLVDLSDQVSGATSSDTATDPAVPESIVNALDEVAKGLTGMVAQYRGGAAAGGDQTKADLDGVTENGGPTAQGAQKAEGIAKAGRKMAKERLERFQKAIDILAGVMKELKLAKSATAPVAKGAAPMTPPGLVTVSEAQFTELLDSVTSFANAADVSKADNTALRTELDSLRKSVGGGNSIAPEGGRGGGPAQVPVAWPIDMNRPISSESTPAPKRFGAGAR